MAQTKQGSFDFTYHHIDAPTVTDEEYGKEHKARKLVVPTQFMSGKKLEAQYREPILAMLADCDWEVRRKLDGENIRIQWNGEQALWNGKSNAFQCSADFTNYMNDTFLEEIFEEKFGREKTVTIFGEKMGPKTQGNELGLDEDQLIIFDVNINGYWLDKWAVKEVADYFKVKTCYDYTDISEQYARPLPQIIQAVARGDFQNYEGLVATPKVEVKDQQGHRVIVKIKNKDYYRGEYEGRTIWV